MKRALAMLVLAGCSGGGTTAHVTLELATSPMTGSAADGCAITEESLPAAISCIGVSLCANGDGGGCTPVPLAHPGMPHTPPFANELRTTMVSAAGPLDFDAMTSSGLHTLRVVAYDTLGHVSAIGTAANFYLAANGTSIVVRLERVGRWSCGPQTSLGPIAPRALGAAIPLPNGDVLMFGGVTGTVDELGTRAGMPTGATLQRTVEVFDAQTQRVRTLLEGPMGLGRVLFAAVAAPDTLPPYHVYVYGGYDVSGDASVLLLDANQVGSAIGTPLIPASGAHPATPLVITYDPARGTATVADLMLASVPNAGFDVVGDYVGENAFLVLGTGDFTGARPTTSYVKQAYILGPDGHLASGHGSITLSGGRLGTTVTGFGSTTALVFGGATAEPTAQGARNVAGEILNSTMAPTPVMGGGIPHDCVMAAMHTATEVPDPVAFHTATPVTGGLVLAGGLLVGGQDCPMLGVTTQLNPRPLVFLSVPAGLTGISSSDIAAATTPFAPVIFHTATALTAAEGTPGGVLLAGGATRNPPAMFVLEPSSQVGVVTPMGPGRFQYIAGAPLAIARWGHAAARIPGGRVLVAGGFAHTDPALDGTPRLKALDSIEILPLAPAPGPLAGGMCIDDPLGGTPDAGSAMDAAAPHDAGPPPVDASTAADL